MSEVQRNESGEILDHEGRLLRESARYIMGAMNQSSHGANITKKEAERAYERDPASPEAYDKALEARRWADARDARQWEGFRHFDQNRDAYHEAALEEDHRRSQKRKEEQSRDL